MRRASPDGVNPLFMKNLLSIKDLDKDSVLGIIGESGKMQKLLEARTLPKLLDGRIMATLFYEPSTRTRLSFEAAMQRLGGGVIGFADKSSSSAMKGESLADTVQAVSSYADVIVLRHDEAGATRGAARFSDVPIINAGDGIGEHPSQTLVDLFTINSEKGKLDGLKIAIVGDLKNGRAAHSLAHALEMFENDVVFIAPKELQMPNEICYELEKSCAVEKTDSLNAALDADIVYMTRIKREWFPSYQEYLKLSGRYVVDGRFLEKAGKDVTIMSPLPRVDEISNEIDGRDNAAYFRQAANGVPVRMAILKQILSA